MVHVLHMLTVLFFQYLYDLFYYSHSLLDFLIKYIFEYIKVLFY